LATWCISLLLPKTAPDGVFSSVVLFPLGRAGAGIRLSELWTALGNAYWGEGFILSVVAGALALLVIRRCGALGVLSTGSTTAKLLSGAFLSFALLILADFFTSSSQLYPFGDQARYLLLATFALVFAVRANAHWWRILMVTLLACVILQSVYAVSLYAAGVNTFTSTSVTIPRATGTLGDLNPNYLYPLCLMGALLLTPFAAHTDRLSLRLIYWPAMGILVTALVLTFSRAAAMGLVAGFVWLAYEERRNKRYRALAAAAVLVMVSVFSVRSVAAPQHCGTDRTALGRIQIWRVSGKIIRDNWLLGVGYGEYQNAQARRMDSKLAKFNPMNVEAKNQALTMIASHGVLGAAVFLLFVYAVWSACRSSREEDLAPWERRMKQGVRLAGIGILTAGLTDTPLYAYNRFPATFVWLVCMGFLLHLELRNRPPSGERKHGRAFRTVALAAMALAVLGTGSIAALGAMDAYRASRTFDAKMDAVRAEPPFVSMAHVPKAMGDCVIANEDYFFYEHRGYSLVDMHRALRVNIRAGRVKQGGSTITQQLAKNLFFANGRTVRRKVAELIMAVELERRLKKAEILELYLNTIDYGLGARGVGPAARRYFGKDASRLTDAECALLAGLVSRPPKDELAPDRARAALNLTLSRLETTNLSRWASVKDEIASMGESRWLTTHLNARPAAAGRGT